MCFRQVTGRQAPCNASHVNDKRGKFRRWILNGHYSKFPEIGPLTLATLSHDFVAVDLAIDEIDWDIEVPVIVGHRLASVAHRMMRERDISPPERVTIQLQAAMFRWAEASCAASAHATKDLILLQGAGIDYVVTKGPGIAMHAKRLSERPFTDIDILVAEKAFAETLSILRRRGYAEEERNMMPWEGLNRFCREAVNLRSPAGGSIDVHHRIPPWFWGAGIGLSKLRDRAELIVVPGGGELLCASAVDNFLVSALHIVSDKSNPGSNLMAWRDFLLLAQTCTPFEVVEHARAAGLCGWISWIVAALPADLRPTGLAEALGTRTTTYEGGAG